MRIHNICFRGEITKNIGTFWLKKMLIFGAMIILGYLFIFIFFFSSNIHHKSKIIEKDTA